MDVAFKDRCSSRPEVVRVTLDVDRKLEPAPGETGANKKNANKVAATPAVATPCATKPLRIYLPPPLPPYP
jgi:hypothetical protein